MFKSFLATQACTILSSMLTSPSHCSILGKKHLSPTAVFSATKFLWPLNWKQCESLNAKLSTHTAPNRSGGGQQQQPLVHDTLPFEIEEGGCRPRVHQHPCSIWLLVLLPPSSSRRVLRSVVALSSSAIATFFDLQMQPQQPLSRYHHGIMSWYDCFLLSTPNQKNSLPSFVHQEKEAGILII